MRRCAPVRHPATQAVIAAFLLLAPLYALAGTLKPVKLRVHGREVALKTSAVYDGREVYIPLEALNALKASYVLTRREESVIVTPASGPSAEIALARPGREPMLPLSDLNRQLRLPMEVRDGVCDLDGPPHKPVVASKAPAKEPPAREAPKEAPKDETRVASKAAASESRPNPAPSSDASRQEVSEQKSSSSFPRTTAQKLSVQPPASLDPDGGRSSNGGPVGKTDNGKGQSPQLIAGSRKPVSIAASHRPQSDYQTSQVLEGSSSSQRRQPESATPEPTIFDEDIVITLPPSGTPEATSPSANPHLRAPAAAVNIVDVQFEAVDEKNARIRIKTSAKPQVDVRLLRGPTRLSIDIARSAVASELREWTVDHPFLSAMRLVQGDRPGTSRLVVDLAELIGYNVEEPTADGVVLNLMTPRGSGKKLQALRVVVDAGHGGSSSTGTSGISNGVRVYEKHLTLSMAKKLQRMLTEAGVDVIMTRTTDTAVGLDERPSIANRNRADLFVSIHVDDCGIPNSASGTTAYYHMDDASSRALAHSIAVNIGKVSGLPVRGAYSDRRRFPRSGMAVLRGSRVPATLVEVAYINNWKDRAKLVDPDFHQTVAQAIFEGIKDYVRADLPDDVAAVEIGTN